MVSVFIEYLQSLGNTIPEDQRLWVSLAIYTVLIIFYSVFIWYFYKFLYFPSCFTGKTLTKIH